MLASPVRPSSPASPPPPMTPPASPTKSRVTSFMTPRRKRPQSARTASAASNGSAMVGGSGVASGPSSPEVKTPASPPRSPRTQRTLRFAHIADLFVKLRRLQNNARQANDLESTSGPEPVTHAELKDDSSVKKHARLELEEVFMCANGVDVVKLLRASRGTLLDAAKLLRSNVLVDETWSCIICRPKSRPDGPYKVYVTYGAFVASCSKQDPHRPVSTQEARGVPGLMTILNRESICLKAEPFPPKPT